MVRIKGLEPSRELPHSDLNAARLPIPPYPHMIIRSTVRRIDQPFATAKGLCANSLLAVPLPTRYIHCMVEWTHLPGLAPYVETLAAMEARVAAIAAGDAPEAVWLLEHPPLYTSGTSTNPSDLLDARFPVHVAGRGGQYTYHGPGQRVAYVMLDLNKRGRDVRKFVCALENWVIGTLSDFNVRGERRTGRVGVWVNRPDRVGPTGQPAEDKIAAIGVKLRRWVSFHGISINVEPDLRHFDGIVPCGISDHGVTSLVDLGLPVTMADLDLALRRHFDLTFAAHQP